MSEFDTVRMLVHRWTADSDTFSRSEWDTSMDRIETRGLVYGQGTLAARAAAAATNTSTLYWATDHNNLYYSDGAAWTALWRKTTLTARAWRSADQGSLSASAYTQVALDQSTITGNVEGSAITLTSNRLVVPKAGLYVITGNVSFVPAGAAVSFKGAITKNGTPILEGRQHYPGGSHDITVEISGVLVLAANDAIGLAALPQGNGSIPVRGGTLYTSLTVTAVQVL